jgi:hypothetical protein
MIFPKRIDGGGLITLRFNSHAVKLSRKGNR